MDFVRAPLGRIFQDSDWLRDGPMRRIGPPWGIFGQESLQIPPAERSPGSTLGLGPLLDIQTFGGRRRRQFEPRYARVEPPPAPTASGPISNIGPRPRADPRTYEFLEYFDSHSEMTAFITETREAFTQAKKVALAKKEQPTTMSTAPACPPTSDLEPEVEEQPPSWPLAPYNCEFQYSNWSDTGEELPLAPGLVPVVLASDWLLPRCTEERNLVPGTGTTGHPRPGALTPSSTFLPTTSETIDGTASSLLSAPVACSADNACIMENKMEEIDLHTLHYCGGNYADTGIVQVYCEV